MLRRVSRVRKHPLLGIWEHAYSPTKWIVSVSSGKLTVDGVDSSNWEKYRVSNLSWTNTVLKFTSLYPSTGRIVSNTYTALSTRQMKVLLCYEVTEIWSRSTSHLASRKHQSKLDSRPRKTWLAGNWHNPEGDDARVICAISLSNNSWNICAEDIGDGERLRVTAVRWNGRSLSFRTTMLSTGQVCHRTLTPLSPDRLKVVLQFQEPEIWERLVSCDKTSNK